MLQHVIFIIVSSKNKTKENKMKEKSTVTITKELIETLPISMLADVIDYISLELKNRLEQQTIESNKLKECIDLLDKATNKLL